jgi:predicted O-methyltransferase YrrM
MPKITQKLHLGKTRNYLLKKIFPVCQELGFHVLLNHFYSPVPDTRTLKEDLWSKPSELVGLSLNENEQLELLSLFASNYKEEYTNFFKNPTSDIHQYYLNNTSFGSVDAEILYCMVRHFKPKRILEIGSGYTTLLFAQSILKNKQENGKYDCELVTIDPYPSEVLHDKIPGLSRVIIKKVQDVPLSEFEKLKANDVLFIDSSHVIKTGSDVAYEYLDILPRLNPGVIIHSHDIFLPTEYHKEWILEDHIFWNEQYLLQAFLAFNDSFKMLWGGSFMHLRHSDKLRLAFPSYSKEKNWPVSFWMKRIK